MHKQTCLAILIVQLASLFFVTSARANDTAFGGSGAAPMPIAQSEIEMVAEEIVLRGTDIGNERGEGRWDVTCDFTFRNLSDQPQTITMGFPFPTRDGEEEGEMVAIPKGKRAKRGAPLVYDFKVTIDGKPITIKRSKITPDKAKGQDYQEAYLWEMSFAPHQTVHVHHTYSTGVTWDVMGYSWANYVLKTGGNWKGGKIGSSKLTIIPNEIVRPCFDLEKDADYLKPKPDGMRAKGKGEGQRFVWEFRNFAPKEDLLLCLQTGSNFASRKILFPVAIYGEVEEQLHALSPEELRVLRNTVYARHGRIFKDSALQKHFTKQWWYQPNPAFTEKMLTDDDHRILKAIAEAESGRKKE